MNNKFISLSPSSGLALYKSCPKCFWLHYNANIKCPRGIFPSLPGGIDLVLKKRFDLFRGSLPPELAGKKIKGNLLKDHNLINRWRNWRTGLNYIDKKLNAKLFGALDDCLELTIGKKKYYVPLDYKTKGSAPRDGDSEIYYQTQLDCYGLFLKSNGYPIVDYALLLYYTPRLVKEEGIVFDVHPVKVGIDTDRIKVLFEETVGVLRGEMPEASAECEYCNFVEDRNRYISNEI